MTILQITFTGERAAVGCSRQPVSGISLQDGGIVDFRVLALLISYSFSTPGELLPAWRVAFLPCVRNILMLETTEKGSRAYDLSERTSASS